MRGRLPEGQRENAILVPQKGITRDPTGQASAMVIDDNNTVQKVNVTTERAVGNQWLIASGLNDGDRLVVDGLQRIQPGMPVSPVDTEAKQPASATPGPRPSRRGLTQLTRHKRETGFPWPDFLLTVPFLPG